MANSTIGKKAAQERPSLVTFAKPDDPIYSRGWTITTRAWGKLPKPVSKSSNQDKQKD